MEGLNALQQQAATCGPGPRLVLAGPGTGKTTTLVARLFHLAQSGILPERILAVTFTRKAGEEMSNRLQALLASRQLAVGTFHSFALRLLREFGEAIGLPRQFRVLDENAQRALLAQLSIRWTPDQGMELPEIFAFAKARMLDPAQFEKYIAKRTQAGELAATDPLVLAVPHYHTYQKALRDQGACDFEDLIAYAVHLCQTHPAITKQIAARYDHLLVDEFQDVNAGQFRLLQALLVGHRNLWCVGDDDQSIYTFRGADASFTLQFKTHFPEAVVHHLQENYRSSAAILGCADLLIQANRNRHPKTLRSVQQSGPPVVLIPFPDAHEEARWIAAATQKVLEKNVPAREIAVLFRVGQQAFPLQLAFQQARIPCILQGAGDFWEIPPARYLRALLRLSENRRDALGLRLLGEGRRAEQWLKSLPSRQKLVYPRQVTTLRDLLIEDPPYGFSQPKTADWIERVRAAAGAAQRFDSCADLEAWIAEAASSLRHQGRDRVTLSTIHSAKGLEWHTVFLAGFEADLLPHLLSADNLQEERRLAYVALTRAKRYLCLSYCETRNDQPSGPSGFLTHLEDRAPGHWMVRRGDPPQNQPANPPAANLKRPWTNAEEQKLARLWFSGRSIDDIAAKLQRSKEAVKSRIERIDPHDQQRMTQTLQLENIEDKALTLMDHASVLQWMNRPLRELNGKTPHQAAETASGYRKVLRLLQRLAQAQSRDSA